MWLSSLTTGQASKEHVLQHCRPMAALSQSRARSPQPRRRAAAVDFDVWQQPLPKCKNAYHCMVLLWCDLMLVGHSRANSNGSGNVAGDLQVVLVCNYGTHCFAFSPTLTPPCNIPVLQQYLDQIKADPEVCAINGQPPPPKRQRSTPTPAAGVSVLTGVPTAPHTSSKQTCLDFSAGSVAVSHAPSRSTYQGFTVLAMLPCQPAV